MLHNDSVGAASTRMIFRRVAFDNNGTTGLPLILGRRTIGDQVVFSACTGTRVGPTQKIFAGDGTNVYSPLYDAAQAGVAPFGGSNIII